MFQFRILSLVVITAIYAIQVRFFVNVIGICLGLSVFGMIFLVLIVAGTALFSESKNGQLDVDANRFSMLGIWLTQLTFVYFLVNLSLVFFV